MTAFHTTFISLSERFDPDIRVIRNDDMTVEEIETLAPDRIILSPGPGRPEDAGVIIEAARTVSKKIPTLGVCLGHQAICAAYGATCHICKETHARQAVFHTLQGKISDIQGNRRGRSRSALSFACSRRGHYPRRVWKLPQLPMTAR